MTSIIGNTIYIVTTANEPPLAVYANHSVAHFKAFRLNEACVLSDTTGYKVYPVVIQDDFLDAEVSGYRAARSGKNQSSNPYSESADHSSSWLAGWKRGWSE
jgi:ribosome modulation factor